MNPHETAKLFLEARHWARLFSMVKSIETASQWWSLYESYLDSAAWQRKSQARIAIDDERCAKCEITSGYATTLQVHHLRYDHIGDEDVENDLVTLCLVCHKEEHGRLHELIGRPGPKTIQECLAIFADNLEFMLRRAVVAA